VSVSPVRSVAAAVAVSAVSGLPVLLLGGLAVLVQQDLSFNKAELGIAVAVFFASGALAAAPGGRLAERVGPTSATRLGVGFVVGSLLGIGLFAHSWASLVVLLTLGGIGNAMAQLGTSVQVVRGVASHRHGVALGIKQAAFPLASLLAGLSVPAIGLTLGWRWAFVLGAVIAPVAAALPLGQSQRNEGTELRDRRGPVRPLILLAIGMALASAGITACTAFFVASSVDRGLSPADAGLVLAAGSFVGLSVRVAGGWLGDRLGPEALVMLLAMLVALSAVGYYGLSFSEHPAVVAAFATLAFGGGWGSGGVVLHVASRSNAVAPGVAMAIVYAGGNAGSVLGPLVFGAVAERTTFASSWLAMGAISVLGVGTILVSRHGMFGVSPNRP